MNDTVPSIAEGRMDDWTVYRDGQVHVDITTDLAITTMPRALAERVCDLAIFRPGTTAVRITVTWLYPVPSMTAGRHEVPDELVSDLCAWYARELHGAATRG